MPAFTAGFSSAAAAAAAAASIGNELAAPDFNSSNSNSKCMTANEGFGSSRSSSGSGSSSGCTGEPSSGAGACAGFASAGNNSSSSSSDKDGLVLFAASYVAFVCTGRFPAPGAGTTLRLAAAIDRAVTATAAPPAALLVSLVYLERLRSCRAAAASTSSSAPNADGKTDDTADDSADDAARAWATLVRVPRSRSAASDAATTRLHRLWSAAFMLADVYLNDHAFTARSWGYVTGYTADDCIRMKRALLVCMHHDAWIRPAEYRAWLRLFRDRLHAHHQHVQDPQAASTATASPKATTAIPQPSPPPPLFAAEMERALSRAALLASLAGARAREVLGAEPPLSRGARRPSASSASATTATASTAATTLTPPASPRTRTPPTLAPAPAR
ncbi:hypothetical protein HK405_012378, partial [Cladochytrium tenue]